MLLRAAATHFSEFGFAGASTRSILADADASAPTLYHHFGDKTGLYIAAATAAQDHVLETFSTATAARDDIVDRISALLTAATALRKQHPNVAKFLAVVQQDVSRHPELSQLASYAKEFDEFWCSIAGGSGAPRGTAVALRALVEGLLAVGGAVMPIEDVAAGAEALQQFTRYGAEAMS